LKNTTLEKKLIDVYDKENNKEKIKESNKKYREEHKEEIKLKQKEYYHNKKKEKINNILELERKNKTI
jgi:hypothetical protein